MGEYDKTSALVRLAAGVSHELNNIFMVIDGNLSLVCEQDAVPEAIREMVTESLVAAQRGIALSKNLQAFAGRQPLRPVAVDLRGIVHAVAQAVQRELVGMEMSLALPSRACQVKIDPRYAEIALFELARNAHAAMPANGTIRIELAPVEAGSVPDEGAGPRPSEGIRLTITDNGPGLPPKALAHATEPMFTLKRGAGARVGWGLSLVDGFVRQSGGTMSLSTASGQGLRVEIHLPSVSTCTQPPD